MCSVPSGNKVSRWGDQQDGPVALGTRVDGSDVAKLVLNHAGKPELAEAFLQELGALLLVEGGRRDLGNHGELRQQGVTLLCNLLSKRRQPPQNELERGKGSHQDTVMVARFDTWPKWMPHIGSNSSR